MNLKLKAFLWTLVIVASLSLTIFVFNYWPLVILITIFGVIVAAIIFKIYTIILEEEEEGDEWL